jgi:hypothetical protein
MSIMRIGVYSLAGLAGLAGLTCVFAAFLFSLIGALPSKNNSSINGNRRWPECHAFTTLPSFSLQW